MIGEEISTRTRDWQVSKNYLYEIGARLCASVVRRCDLVKIFYADEELADF